MFMLTQNKRLIGIVLTVALLLLVPLIAMQFTEEVRWSLFDFVIMGVLLLGTGLMCELVMRKVKKKQHRIALCLALLAALFIVWAELAVGIFGTPFAGS
jgi:ABC-type Mn2+/Zn2+ transport system permease subunit